MKPKALLVLLAIVLVVSMVAFAACGGEEEPTPVPPTTPPPTTPTAPTTPTEPPPPPPPPPFEWPRKLVLVSSGTTSSSYAVSIAWSTPLAEDTGMTVRVVAEGMRTLRLTWLQQGTAFASSEAAGGKLLMQSKAEYATRGGGPINLRVFWVQGKFERGHVTQRDSEIKTPSDIKPGTRMVDLTFMPAYEEDDLLAWAQVNPEDIVWVPAANMAQMAKHIMDGKADVSLVVGTSSPMWYEAEAAPRGLSFLDMNAEKDPEGAARYWAVEPEDILGPLKSGVPSSVGKWGVISISSYQTVASADEELVYQMAKWLHENHDRYKDAHSSTKEMTVENALVVAETNFCPIHDGVVRYFKELGVWTAEHQARQDFNVARLNSYVEAFQVAIDYADNNDIAVTPENEEWLELWYSYRDKLDPLTGYTGLD